MYIFFQTLFCSFSLPKSLCMKNSTPTPLCYLGNRSYHSRIMWHVWTPLMTLPKEYSTSLPTELFLLDPMCRYVCCSGSILQMKAGDVVSEQSQNYKDAFPNTWLACRLTFTCTCTLIYTWQAFSSDSDGDDHCTCTFQRFKLVI